MSQKECYWSETATFQDIVDYQVAREKLNFEKELENTLLLFTVN